MKQFQFVWQRDPVDSKIHHLIRDGFWVGSVTKQNSHRWNMHKISPTMDVNCWFYISYEHTLGAAKMMLEKEFRP